MHVDDRLMPVPILLLCGVVVVMLATGQPWSMVAGVIAAGGACVLFGFILLVGLTSQLERGDATEPGSETGSGH
jgi:hypothetical protein